MTEQPLFPPTAEETAARIDGEIRDLIVGHRGGPMGLRLEDNEKAVLRAIRGHNGAASAIPIRAIAAGAGLDIRTIKSVVRALRMSFHLPIGSSKHGEAGGYFLMVTEADVALWASDVLAQVRAEISVLKAAAGRKRAIELAGQIREELLMEANS